MMGFRAGSAFRYREQRSILFFGIVTSASCSQSTPHTREALQPMISSVQSFLFIMFSFSVSNLGNSTLNPHTHNALWKDNLEKQLKHFSPNWIVSSSGRSTLTREQHPYRTVCTCCQRRRSRSRTRSSSAQRSLRVTVTTTTHSK